MVGRVKVAACTLSLDGFGAGPEQSLDDPLNRRGPEIFSWFHRTKTFKAMMGRDGGSDGVDETFPARGYRVKDSTATDLATHVVLGR